MIREALNMAVGNLVEDLSIMALARWGEKEQSLACAGELNELCARLIPHGQGRMVSRFSIQEEIADAIITLNQMTRVYFKDPHELSTTLRLKLSKLEHHLAQSMPSPFTDLKPKGAL